MRSASHSGRRFGLRVCRLSVSPATRIDSRAGDDLLGALRITASMHQGMNCG